MVGSFDSSFANNYDSSSQLEQIFFSCDAPKKLVPMHLKSYKSRRFAGSASSGEVIALSYMFDVATSIVQ